MDAPTRRLAHAATGAHELDEALSDRARLLLFDYLAVATQGSVSASSAAAREALAADSAPQTAVVEGTGLWTSTSTAALLNAVSGHGIELDDTHEPASLHPGVVVWPTVLALGDERDASPAEMLAAAAAAGRLLGLSTAQMVSAFGIAATSACGSMEYLSDGAWTKRLNPALPASNGILAARAWRPAASGARGPPSRAARASCRATATPIPSRGRTFPSSRAKASGRRASSSIPAAGTSTGASTS